MRSAATFLALGLIGFWIAATQAWGAATPGAAASWETPGWRWRRVPVRLSGEGEGLVAVASVASAEGGPSRTAVADFEGVSVRVGDQPFRFAARVRGISDLAFAQGGSLWIASTAGLWHLAMDGRLTDVSPAPGELARTIHRVRVERETVVVGTDDGAFVSRDAGAHWRRVADAVPSGPVQALALAAESLWLVVGEEVWRIGLEATAHGQQVSLSGSPSGVAPTDIATGLPGAGVAVLYPRALAILVSDASRTSNVSDDARPAFRVVRPVWPPGAVASRLASGAGRVWVGTDLGLLHASSVDGPWRRSEAPAGSASIRSVAGGAPDTLLAATGMGLLHGAPVVLATRLDSKGTWRSDAGPDLPSDPDVREVHAASLRYLDLAPDHMRKLGAGIRRRGWLPSVSLRLAAARDRSNGRNYDEQFTSGDTRRLNDWDRDSSLDLEASLVMSWSLGDIAFDDSAIDLSREHRQVVALRDNVIDEINQLYFERRGLLEKIHAPELAPELDRRALELRAAELAAGLDAWTGGWFSRQRSGASAHPPNGLRPNSKEDQ